MKRLPSTIYLSFLFGLVLLAVNVHSPAIAQETVQPIYGAPYTMHDERYTGNHIGPTIEDAVSTWYEVYKQYWGVSPYGSLECSYSIYYRADGTQTGIFAGVSLQGDCTGGNYVTGEKTCPEGHELSGNLCYSTGPSKEEEQKKKNDGEPENCGAGNPCNPANGNKYQREVDYLSPDGKTSVVRYYNSNRVSKSYALGRGWISENRKHLEIYTNLISLIRGDGKGEPFEKVGGVWIADADSRLKLTENTLGYLIEYPDTSYTLYNEDGWPISDTDRYGRTTTYIREDGNTGRLIGKRGPFGHELVLEYGSDNNLSSVTIPDGNKIHYTYDANNNLVRVTYPDGSYKQYQYENSTFPNHLTGITDENGDRFATYGYDSQGRAILTEHAGGQERFTLNYDSDTQTTVTDAAGTQEILQFEENLGLKNLLSQVHPVDGKGITQTFDANNNLLSHTDEEDQTTSYTYNGNNQRTSMTEAAGTAQARTTTYTYVSADLDLPTQITRPSVATGKSFTTTIGYDGNRNPVTITQAGFTPVGTAISRAIGLQYNSQGQAITIDGPRTDVSDVTTLAYYECTTGVECGQLKSLANALDQTTTFDSYDVHGRLLQQTGPNGLMIGYAYNLRGRVSTITRTAAGGEVRSTAYTYYPNGKLKTVTTPTGLILTYTYNAAQELIQITDSLGNRIEYAYDSRGNRIVKNTRDPDNTLVRTVETEYDLRNRIKTINNAGSITALINDAVGNLISETDPNQNPDTQHDHDALDRLLQTIDSLGGATAYGYDAHDRLTQVAAANGATTQYVYDDLGNLLGEVSPDRGTTTYRHDTVGNVIGRTDARGTAVGYIYDPLNRVTAVDYPGTDEDVVLVYDTCTNGAGYLCQVTDASGTTQYNYNAFGNLTGQAQTILGISYTTTYTYDSGDRIQTLTYPDDRVVAYTRDPLGRITGVTSTLNDSPQTLTQNIAYRADGLLTNQTFGNGLTESRTYDLEGQLISLTVGADSRAYQYDANGNVLSILNPSQNSSYAYDALDRLQTDAWISAIADQVLAFTYDENGNRLSLTTDGTPEAYTYLPVSNRLTQIGNKTLTLDAAGNTVSKDNGKWTYSYNQAGRLHQVYKNSQLKATYTYNAQGQRVLKTLPRGINTDTTVYHYDQTGQLIAETGPDGTPQKDYLWAENRPLAQIPVKQNKKTGTVTDKQIYYLHSDHLGTPRQATDSTGRIVWAWEADAFGSQKPVDDPDGDGKKVKVNLRFPGQYYDKESKLFYNWNRYYDPRTGRYITSDPMSIRDHVLRSQLVAPPGMETSNQTTPLELNPYVYVANNPLRWIDPKGNGILRLIPIPVICPYDTESALDCVYICPDRNNSIFFVRKGGCNSICKNSIIRYFFLYEL